MHRFREDLKGWCNCAEDRVTDVRRVHSISRGGVLGYVLKHVENPVQILS
jgi:hypothetical protein